MPKHDVKDRRHPRYRTTLTGYLEIIMPEVTFAPRRLHVMATDLSVGGCRLLTKSVTPDLYRVMIREIRHSKMELDLQDGRVLNLRGKVVWMEFIKSAGETHLAVQFQQLTPTAETVLQNLFNELLAKGSINEVPTNRPVVDLKPLDEEGARANAPEEGTQ